MRKVEPPAAPQLVSASGSAHVQGMEPTTGEGSDSATEYFYIEEYRDDTDEEDVYDDFDDDNDDDDDDVEYTMNIDEV